MQLNVGVRIVKNFVRLLATWWSVCLTCLVFFRYHESKRKRHRDELNRQGAETWEQNLRGEAPWQIERKKQEAIERLEAEMIVDSAPSRWPRLSWRPCHQANSAHEYWTYKGIFITFNFPSDWMSPVHQFGHNYRLLILWKLGTGLLSKAWKKLSLLYRMSLIYFKAWLWVASFSAAWQI